MIGKSDQVAWVPKADARICISFPPRASSLITTAAAPTFNSSAIWDAVLQMWQDTSTPVRTAETRSASRPLGARIRTRKSLSVGRVMSGNFVAAINSPSLADQYIGDAGEYTFKI